MRVEEGTAVIHHSADLMSDGDTSAAALSLNSARFTKKQKKKKKLLCCRVSAVDLSSFVFYPIKLFFFSA